MSPEYLSKLIRALFIEIKSMHALGEIIIIALAVFVIGAPIVVLFIAAFWSTITFIWVVCCFVYFAAEKCVKKILSPITEFAPTEATELL